MTTGAGTRGLMVAVVAMGVLIVVGTMTLGVLMVRKLGEAAAPANAVLDEPPGTRITAMAALPDRLALLLSGGGPDRVVLVDARSGRPVGRVLLAH